MATLAPIVNTSLIVQLHLACALLALIILPIMLLRPKGDGLHRVLGRSWIVLMAGAALSSFWITGFKLVGPYSPIHLLSLITLYFLYRGYVLVRRGRIAEHGDTLRGLGLWGLGVAGLLALLPGRTLNVTLFGQFEVEGFLAVLGVTILAWSFVRFRSRVKNRA